MKQADMDVEGLQDYILNKLDEELDPRMTYHNSGHTLDVMISAMRLAEMEKVNGYEKDLLRSAALIHDTGMLRTYSDHEDASCEIGREILPQFGYSEEEVEKIIEMIMSTKLPQSAKNISEKILCDADLDYLGRDDFHMLSFSLKYEWDTMGINPTTLNEWYHIQVEFLSSHAYYTDSARNLRQAKKEQFLNQIREICEFKK